MSRARNPIPVPRCHKGSAVVDVYHGAKRRTVTLGPWGSSQAEKEFARLLAERSVSPAVFSAAPSGISVAELLLAYLKFATGYYADPDGRPTKELGCMKAAIKPVRELYTALPAKEFGPLALRAVRQRMVDAGLCRGLVNRRTDRVKRVFKWAVAEELVPVATFEALRTLSGLRFGRTEARESKPVEPVPEEVVRATLLTCLRMYAPSWS